MGYGGNFGGGGYGAPPGGGYGGPPGGGWGGGAPPPGGGWGAPPGGAMMTPMGGGGMMRYSPKDQGTAFLLGAFLGSWGADRFYLGQTGLGIAKLLTCGGLGIWAIVDLILIGMGKMTDADGLTLAREPTAGTPQKSQGTAFLLAYFLGIFGADRFYLGQTGLGIAKLLTCGGMGIWALIDLILIGMGKMKDAEGNSLSYDM